MRPWLPAVVVTGIQLWPAAHAAGATNVRLERTERLLAPAKRRLAEGTREQRQFAFSELEQAMLLAPARRHRARARAAGA